MHILGDINFLVESDVKIGMTFPVQCTQRRGRFMGIRIDNSNLVMYSIPDCKRSDRRDRACKAGTCKLGRDRSLLVLRNRV